MQTVTFMAFLVSFWLPGLLKVSLLKILCQEHCFPALLLSLTVFIDCATVNATLNIFKLPPPGFVERKAIWKTCGGASLLNQSQAILAGPLEISCSQSPSQPPHLQSASVVRAELTVALPLFAVTVLSFPSELLLSKHHSSAVVEAGHWDLVRAWAVPSALCFPGLGISLQNH